MPHARLPSRRALPPWTREVVLALIFYGLYTVSRDLQGSATVSYAHALSDATDVIRLERHLGVFHEAALQRLMVEHRMVIETANVVYGSLHMIVTIAVLVFLYRRSRATYRRARNTLAVTTALALVGFVAFPTMPPRLLPASYGFVDTLARYGTLWSFDSATVAKLSNQYAAMPSLHFAWALWCAISLAPVLHHRTSKVLAYTYPLLTFVVIIGTANHFVLDALLGAVALIIGRLATTHLTHDDPKTTTNSVANP